MKVRELSGQSYPLYTLAQ